MGKAVQVIRPVVHENRQQLELDVEKLKKILLSPDVADKKVIVLSISGKYRQGKSFFMSFVVKYLENAMRNSGQLAEGYWLKEGDRIGSDFEWKGGDEPVTNGIFIYDKVFLINDKEEKNGKKVAVVLMDTQGLFDHNATLQYSTTLFALSAMISSMQIFNLSRVLDSSDIDHLSQFTTYAKAALGGEAFQGSSLQSLMFLIRDWSFPYKHAYGIQGGNTYITKQLQEGQNMDARDCIRESFDAIHGCTLPYPGNTVAADDGSTFKGELKHVAKDFTDTIEMAVPFILKNCSVKLVGGEKITCRDLVTYFEKYTEAIQDGKLPDIESMYEITVNTFNTNVLRETMNIYEKKLQENEVAGYFKDLDQCHRLGENVFDFPFTAFDYFNLAKKLGTPKTQETLKEKLKEEIRAKYDACCKMNATMGKVAIGAVLVGGVAAVGAVAAAPFVAPEAAAVGAALVVNVIKGALRPP